MEAAIARLARTRPTAVNLFWALDQMQEVLVANQSRDNHAICDALLAAAHRLFEEDRRICRQIGAHGAALLRDGSQVITHCNAGGLATADYGTALGVVYAAQETGKKVRRICRRNSPVAPGVAADLRGS